MEATPRPACQLPACLRRTHRASRAAGYNRAPPLPPRRVTPPTPRARPPGPAAPAATVGGVLHQGEHPAGHEPGGPHRRRRRRVTSMTSTTPRPVTTSTRPPGPGGGHLVVPDGAAGVDDDLDPVALHGISHWARMPDLYPAHLPRSDSPPPARRPPARHAPPVAYRPAGRSGSADAAGRAAQRDPWRSTISGRPKHLDRFRSVNTSGDRARGEHRAPAQQHRVGEALGHLLDVVGDHHHRGRHAGHGPARRSGAAGPPGRRGPARRRARRAAAARGRASAPGRSGPACARPRTGWRTGAGSGARSRARRAVPPPGSRRWTRSPPSTGPTIA